jgi:hypothetical protein
VRQQLTSIALIALLTACGGGGGGSAGSTLTIAGAVIDGYIEGAIVCLDVNGNFSCDSTEPQSTTDSNGKYSISYSGSTEGLHVLTEVPATAKDKDDGGLTLTQAGKTAFTLKAPAPTTSSTDTHVTPLSTIVSQEMISTGSNNVASVEAQLKTQLGINNLLNYDFKASNSTANTNAAALAVAITNAISAAQASLAGSDAFKTAMGTTNAATIKAAAAQGAINLVMKNVLPQMIDKETGSLSSTVTSASAMEAAAAAASSNIQKIAITAKAPKAENASLQAFLDGIVIGGDDHGQYTNASGNLITYTNALNVEFIQADSTALLSRSVKKVLVNGRWYSRLNSGQEYYLTKDGWYRQEDNLPGGTLEDCVGGKETTNGPTIKICLTKYDYSGKKVSSLLKDACKDDNGNPIANCNEDTLFPANTYSYSAKFSYLEETFKVWVSSTWNGYGDGFNPRQTTLTGWITAAMNGSVVQWIGNNCNVGFKVQSYDATTKTGVLSFGDYSRYTCNNAHQNNSNVTFSATSKFSFKERNGVQILVYQVPMLYKKLNPDDGAQWQLFVEKDNNIQSGQYYPTSYSGVIGLDGSTKLGNKNLLDTYLSMIGAAAFPYPQ